jgi:lipopolysaccharide heptosyltransferase I
VAINRVLIVRLGALGDIIHALPVVAALREARPGVAIDWLANAKHRAILDLVPTIDRRVFLGPRPAGASAPSAPDTFLGASGLVRAIRSLRAARYDVALDLQGLGKSAILARASGARRVVGFPSGHLREAWARPFYGEVSDPSGTVHVIDKNLSLVRAIGVTVTDRAATLDAGWFPITVPDSSIVETVTRLLPLASGGRFALINPGGGWPNKRWPTARLAAVASMLAARHRLASIVLWGPGEERLASAVVAAAGGSAAMAPPTSIAAMLSLAKAAQLIVSGDTGPLHLAAAVGTPVVGIYGPTSPRRNGPWNLEDVSLSRFDDCVCHHKRHCRRTSSCLLDIGVDEVVAAIDRRLASRTPTP